MTCEVADTLTGVVMIQVSGNSHRAFVESLKKEKRRKIMANVKTIRVRLQAYDHKVLDAAVAKVVKVAKDTGAKVVGPIPLPTEKQVYTILRSVHKDKDSREQFEIRTHKRLIDIINPKKETVDMLKRLDLPSGVDIDAKL